MISETVMKQAVWFHGIAHFACNVCSRCGEEDDPESARRWPGDADGHKVCWKCAEAEDAGFDRTE